MKLSQTVQNMIGDSAIAGRATVEIPMGMAVKIAFSLGMLDAILDIAKDGIKYKYTETDESKDGENE